MRHLPRIIGLAAIVMLAPQFASAQVSNGGAVVSIYPSAIRVPFCVVMQPDSGALVLLQDTRSGTADIYSQRLDRHGRALNGEGGTLVASMPANEFVDTWLPDGSGGVILAKAEDRGASGKDIVLRRVLSNGTQSYGANGIVICNATRDQVSPALVAGPSGSYYVVWADDRTDPDYYQNIFAQRVSLAGSPMWAANGIQIDTPTYMMWGNAIHTVISDLNGGFIATWEPNSPLSTRAQRVNSSGTLLWTAIGMQFGGANDRLTSFGADGTGGIWGLNTTWDGTYSRFYAHRLLANGTPALALTGVEVHSPVYQASVSVQILRDGTGGAWFYAMPWYQSTSLTRPLERQHISATGTLLRPGDGDLMGYFTAFPVFVDAGTAELVGYSEVVSQEGMTRMRLQRYALDGTPTYAGLGVVVGRDEPNRLVLLSAMDMMSNGVIGAAWADGRYLSPTNSLNVQAFGQAVTPLGSPLWDDSEPPAIQTARDAAGDQGGFVRVTWNASLTDHPAARAAKGYRVWRSLAGSAVASLTSLRASVVEGIDATADRTFEFEGRPVLKHANAYWEVAGQQAAATLAQYAMTVPTMQDSMAGSPGDQSFMVEAYDDSSHHWFSAGITTHSVDNLAPGIPQPASGFYAIGQTTLYWGGVSAADLCCYDVYRGGNAGFVPSDANRVTSTEGTGYVDAAGGPFFYRIAARDIHGNRGPSALVVPQGITGVDDAMVHEWKLATSWKSGALELALDLPNADEGRVELFDVSGRRLWSAPYHVSAAQALRFEVSRETRLTTGVMFARAVSATGRELKARVLVLR